MSTATSKKDTCRQLVHHHGTLFSEELGIDLKKGTPSPLFRWLCASLLCSARISGELALAAARRLADEGWTTAKKMAATSWKDRVRALNDSGYARYDESTSRMLGENCEMLLKHYSGDLRKLREQADRDPRQERRLLKQCKGIGDVGADIFFREVQLIWDEHYPFTDKITLKAAKQLELGETVGDLAELVSKKQLPRLAAALVRVDQQQLYGEYGRGD